MTLKEAYDLAASKGDTQQPVDGSPSPAPRSWRESRMRRTLQDASQSPSKDRWRTQEKDDNNGARRNFSDEIEGLPKLVPGIEDMLDSPAKSLGWDMENDFTAGDLQISDSPRIRMSAVNNRPFGLESSPPVTNPGSSNMKLAEIRSREQGPTGNNKLAEIQAREQVAERESFVGGRFVPRSMRTKLDDIEQLEANGGLSRRAIAAARLAEIKEQNGMTRSLSPDDVRASHRVRREADLLPARSRSAVGSSGGTRVAGTPVTIFKSRRDWAAADTNTTTTTNGAPSKSAAITTATSKRDQELLRRLARATSSSPAREPAAEGDRDLLRNKSPARQKRLSERVDAKPPTALRSAVGNSARTSSGSSTKPAVGFVGDSRRSSSNESAKSKRSSAMFSDPDPTDRLASENKLFAPLDNYSERGSVRAPSPLPDDDDDDNNNVDIAADATPRPNKPDTSSMPTPRVVGAFVDTPVTVKVEKQEEQRASSKERRALSTERQTEREQTLELDPSTIFRDKDSPRKGHDSVSRDRNRNRDRGAGIDRDNERREEDKEKERSPSRSRSRSRSRSTSGKRAPLKNSAKLPSVREDLLELQRMHNMDDNTIEDLEDILAGRQAKLDELLKSIGREDDDAQAQAKAQVKVNANVPDIKLEKGEESPPSAMERMSRTLQSGILGIHDVKQDVDELKERESKAAKAAKAIEAQVEPSPSRQKQRQHQQQQQQQRAQQQHQHYAEKAGVAYVHFPLPRLYQRTPSFRLTLMGVLILVLSAWYAAESAVCSKYCRPTTCSGSSSCIFSYDDPSFGYAIPVKVDELVTAGKGRAWWNDALEEARDWAADVADSLHGRAITDVDVSALSFDQRKRLRRRLEKRGMLRAPAEPRPEQRVKWDAWRRERVARERAREASEVYGDGAVGDDERVW